MFKKIIDKWNSVSLILRILCGFLLGGILGFLAWWLNISAGLDWLSVFGDLFVGALKSVAPVLVFVLILSSIAGANGKLGKRFALVIALYMITTLLASVIAVVASFIFPIKLDLTGIVGEETATAGSLGAVMKNLLSSIVVNPVSALLNANYLGILFWSITLGFAFKFVASDATKKVVKDIADAVSMVVRGVISLAPFGIMGITYSTISAGGFAPLLSYAKITALIVGCMLLTSLVINPAIIAIILKKNPYPLVGRCLKNSGLTAFFTRSSAANIPVNMKLCSDLGLDPDFYSVSIPLGATINMDGAAITIAVMALAAAHTVGVEVSFGAALLLSVVATLAACGASGVAGGSLMLIPLACSLFGINNDIAMQVVAVGMIIGIIQDSVETALNSSGDVIFTATAEYCEWKKAGKEIDFHYQKPAETSSEEKPENE